MARVEGLSTIIKFKNKGMKIKLIYFGINCIGIKQKFNCANK